MMIFSDSRDPNRVPETLLKTLIKILLNGCTNILYLHTSMKKTNNLQITQTTLYTVDPFLKEP